MSESRPSNAEMLAIAATPFLVAVAITESRHSSLLAGDYRTLAERIFIAAAGALVGFALGKVVTARISENELMRRALLAVCLCLPGSVVLTIVDLGVSAWINPGPAFVPTTILEDISSYAWILLTWVALYTAVMGSKQVQEERRRAALAQSEAHRAQLLALRLQIQPHFLFNTLNTLSGLIGLKRYDEAEAMVANLATFLRRSLTTASEQFAPLKEEIEFHFIYLEIERARFSDRLTLECALPEDCAKALVPNLILQPLVENAVKHGLGGSETGVTIKIGAEKQGQRLSVWVINTASGPGPRAGLGIGLSNVRQRLEALFGRDAVLHAAPGEGGWVSRISLPFIMVDSNESVAG